MKKIFALLLAALMLLSLAACANNEPAATDAPATDALATEAPATDAPATEAPATDAPATDGTLSAEEQAVYDLIFGRMDGENYINEMLGLGFEIDDDWTGYSLEQNLANNGFVADGTLVEQIAAAPMVMILNCTDPEDGSSVNINAEDLPAEMTGDEYLSSQLEATKAALEQMGLANVDVALDTVTFAGSEHSCMQVSCEIQGLPFYETIIAYELPENSIAAITVSAFEKDEVADIIEEFYALNAG